MSRIFKPVADVRKEKNRKRFWTRAKVGFFCALAVALLYVLISYSGRWLVRDDSFGHVSWVVILDGQSGDLERSDFAANLIREGRADSLLVLGRRVFRDRNNADFYAEDLEMVCGVDAGRLFVFRHDDPSTLEEAVSTIPWIKRRTAANDTVLLVTGAPATRRAAFIFNKLSGGHPVFVTADMHNWRYNADSWIFERESRKNWLREWAAIFNAKWELWGVDTLEISSRKRREPLPWRSSGEIAKPEPVKVEKLVSIREAIASQDSAVKEVQGELSPETRGDSALP